MHKPQSMQSLPDLPLDENIALYGRQSSLFQVENRTASNDYQIEEQKKQILAYGWKEHQIIEYFQDFEVSGTLGIGERIGITQLTEDIIAGLVKVVYVFLEDRLFRDRYLENVVKFARICDEHHIVIITIYRRYYMWIEYDREAFIEACKQAWKALDMQINKRMLPMRVYKSHQGMYDARAINIGYTVDRDKHSKTYKKYIPEEGQIESVKNLFNRLIAHGGDLVALAHELEDTPGYHFPKYKDPLSHSKCNMFSVSRGYRIRSVLGLKRILRNPVYIGTWKTGGKEYSNNHMAIIDKDVWELVQTLLDKYEEENRSTPHKQSEDCVLRGLLIRPLQEQMIMIDTTANVIRLRSRKHKNAMRHSKVKTIPLDVLICLFRETFLDKLKDEEQCREYAKAITLVHQREYNNREHIQETYNNLVARYQRLYNTYTEKDGPEPERAKMLARVEMLDIEPEIKRLENVLESKERPIYPLKELEELLVAIRTHWDKLNVSTLNGLARLFCNGITPTPLSSRFWKIEVEWELWGKETWLIWTDQARHIWEPEEIEELRQLAEQGIPQDQWMELLPDQPRWGINAAYLKHLSANPEYRQRYGAELFRSKRYRRDKVNNLSINDRKVAEQYNIDLRSINIDECHLFFIEQITPLTQLKKETEGKNGSGEVLGNEEGKQTTQRTNSTINWWMYAPFNVPQLLNRPLEVSLTKESGIAGLVFLIRQRMGVDLAKDDPRLLKIYNWLMAEFDNGRQTSVEWEELAPIVAQQFGAS